MRPRLHIRRSRRAIEGDWTVNDQLEDDAEATATLDAWHGYHGRWGVTMQRQMRHALDAASAWRKAQADAIEYRIALVTAERDDARNRVEEFERGEAFAHAQERWDHFRAVAEHAESQLAERDAEMHSGPLADIAAERDRQISAEDWTPEHDDAHGQGELAKAASCYALSSTAHPYALDKQLLRVWPWADGWKPKSPRADLVRAGALIVAEIERLDRAALAPHPEKTPDEPTASQRAACLFAKTQAEASGRPQSEVNAIVRESLENMAAKDVTPSA